MVKLGERVGVSMDCDKLYEELCALRKVRSELLCLTTGVSNRWVKFFCHSAARRYTTVMSCTICPVNSSVKREVRKSIQNCECTLDQQ